MLSLLQAQTPLFVALLNQHWPCARALLVGFVMYDNINL